MVGIEKYIKRTVGVVHKIRFCCAAEVNERVATQTTNENLQFFNHPALSRHLLLPSTFPPCQGVLCFVTEREPTNTLLATTTRRTSAQVKQDNARAAAAAVAAQRATSAAQAKQRSDVADLEDQVRKDEQEQQKHANRPDL